MYEKCIKCERLGKDCIPNLYVMSVSEIREWARKRKNALGWSNAYLSEVSGVPKGTIDSNFSKHCGKCADVNYSTFAPVICALIGSGPEEMDCKSPDEALIESLVLIQAEKQEIIQSYEERIQYFKNQMAWRKNVIVVLMVVSSAMILFIMVEIMIDWNDNTIGFFWR